MNIDWVRNYCLSLPNATERPGFVPAPYLARAHWVALEAGHSPPRRVSCQRAGRRRWDAV